MREVKASSPKLVYALFCFRQRRGGILSNLLFETEDLTRILGDKRDGERLKVISLLCVLKDHSLVVYGGVLVLVNRGEKVGGHTGGFITLVASITT